MDGHEQPESEEDNDGAEAEGEERGSSDEESSGKDGD